MKNVKTFAIVGYNASAEEQAAILEATRGDVTIINAFDEGMLKDLLQLRAVPTYGVFITADTLEELEALAIDQQIKYFEQQDEMVTAVETAVSRAVPDGEQDKAAAYIGTVQDVLAVPWVEGEMYNRGQIVTDDDAEGKTHNYRVLHDYTAPGTLKPSEDKTFALHYPMPLYEGGIRVWGKPEKPTGVLGMCYLGEIVLHPDTSDLWRSKVDNNVWEPSDTAHAAWERYTPPDAPSAFPDDMEGEYGPDDPKEEPDEPAIVRWADIPDDAQITPDGEYGVFADYGVVWRVLRDFLKQDHMRPRNNPALEGDYYERVE